MKRICTNCGRRMTDGERICSNCGEPYLGSWPPPPDIDWDEPEEPGKLLTKYPATDIALGVAASLFLSCGWPAIMALFHTPFSFPAYLIGLVAVNGIAKRTGKSWPSLSAGIKLGMSSSGAVVVLAVLGAFSMCFAGALAIT
ncbi:MAG: zinc ribbon domain-containing protein [Capsulimonadaceae bacterium]|nr:zinc ribbon domain-containing protein [Capsulimonadaceae bacterium]